MKKEKNHYNAYISSLNKQKIKIVNIFVSVEQDRQLFFRTYMSLILKVLKVLLFSWKNEIIMILCSLNRLQKGKKQKHYNFKPFLYE